MPDENPISIILGLYFAIGLLQETSWAVSVFGQSHANPEMLKNLLIEYLFRVLTPDPLQLIATLILSIFAWKKTD